MTNAQNARLVSMTTRALGGSVSDQMPLTAGKNNRFEVVVEGIAGILLSTSGQPYSLDIVAFDISAGTSPHSESNNFTQRRSEAFDAANGWPSKVATFTVTLNDIAAVQGHLLRYYAILTSANHIVSFIESPLFLLYRHDLKVGAGSPTEVQSALLSNLPAQMNAKDARIVNLYTAQTDSLVKDNSPNAGPPRATSFDLIVQLEAGIISQGGGDYILNFTPINENTGAPEPMLVPAGNPFIERFLAPDWQARGAHFVRTGTGQPVGILRLNIPVGDLTGRFHYNLEFVSSDFQVTDLGESNSFILARPVRASSLRRPSHPIGYRRLLTRGHSPGNGRLRGRTSGKVIGDRLKLAGAGASLTTISGGSPVVTVGSGTVTISGGSSEPGGGLLNFSGTVTLNDSTVSGNISAIGMGGGINNGGTLTLKDSTVRCNTPDDIHGLYTQKDSTVGGSCT